MITLLKGEQSGGDGMKAYCIESFGLMEDEEKVLALQICGCDR